MERAELAIEKRKDWLSKNASSSVPFDDLLKKENMTKDSVLQKSGAVKDTSKDLSKNDPAAKNTF